MKTQTTILALIIALATSVIAPATACALSLDEGKQQGIVGETPGGYLDVVTGKGSPEAAQLVKTINAQRKARYQEIATQNGTPIKVVEQLAGKKAIENSHSGHYIQLPTGQWAKK